MNPAELCNAPGRRIVKKVDGAAKDMIYLKKVAEPPKPAEPKQAELFDSSNDGGMGPSNDPEACPF